MTGAVEVPAALQREQSTLGHQIRALRKARGLTLSELAARIGRSVGYVSQIERGLSEISIHSLTRIAAALEVQLAWFFQGDQTASPLEQRYLVRGHSRRRLGYSGSGVVEEMLSPQLDGEGLMILTRTEPGASGGEPISRPVEESGLVVRGVLDLAIDGHWFELGEGDSFRIPRGVEHAFRNPGTGVSEVVWFLTPAIY